MPYVQSRSIRRCLCGPALFLALGAVLVCSAPAPAADQTNPKGNTITDRNPGLEATANGDRLTNLGDIQIELDDGTLPAIGMGGGYTLPLSGLTLTNNGSIGAVYYGLGAKAYGMYSADGSSQINNGSIVAIAPLGTAYGMYSTDGSSQVNNGSIVATAPLGTAVGMYSTGNSSQVNNGNILASGTPGIAYGMWAENGGTLVNKGTITAGAGQQTYGMHGEGSRMTNHTFIVVDSAVLNGTSDAYGMWGKDGSTLVNRGDITVTSSGPQPGAYGMYGEGGSTLVNSKNITATAAHSSGAIALKAFGMFGRGGGTLVNSGAITATGTSTGGGTIQVGGMHGEGGSTLVNSGAIIATTTAPNGKAYGISLDSGTAANFGLIRASAPDLANAYEVYNTSDPADTVRVTDWATDLRDFGTYRFFGSSTGGALDLTGSRLILRPGTTERGFAWGKEYAVADMADQKGLGAVASVTQEVPWVRASLTGTDWRDQKLSLHPNFTRKTNPGQLAASQGIAVVLDQARAMGSVIDQQFRSGGAAPAAMAASGPAALTTASGPDSGWSGFLTPYFSYVNNSDLDYDAKIAGGMAGATRRFSDTFAAGVHLGFSHADVSADLADQAGDTLTGLLGLHAFYNLTPDWYVRGQVTGFISRASNHWESGLPDYALYSDPDVDSRGVYAALNTGYDWRINASNTITPEIGLSWLWSHQDSYSLNWEDRFGNSLPGYDLDYKAQDYNALYGTAMLRWRGSFDLAGGSFQPTVGVGVRQTLTDGDVKSRVTASGSSFSTRATEDETTALAEAGFVWQRGITSVGLTYTGGYGEDQSVHTGWLTLKLEF